MMPSIVLLISIQILQLLRWFCNVSTFSVRVTYWIMNNFVKNISTNFKLIFVGKLGKYLVLLESLWWVGFLECDFVILDQRCGRYWILKKISLENNLKIFQQLSRSCSCLKKLQNHVHIGASDINTLGVKIIIN
jgi:hypothetical protein